MFAVLQTGGKQYKVSTGDVISIEKLNAEKGAAVTFDKVLMISDAGSAKLAGALSAAKVTGEVVDHKKNEKVIIFKKHRRHNYRRKNGHRQLQTLVKITAINA